MLPMQIRVAQGINAQYRQPDKVVSTLGNSTIVVLDTYDSRAMAGFFPAPHLDKPGPKPPPPRSCPPVPPPHRQTPPPSLGARSITNTSCMLQLTPEGGLYSATRTIMQLLYMISLLCDATALYAVSCNATAAVTMSLRCLVCELLALQWLDDPAAGPPAQSTVCWLAWRASSLTRWLVPYACG